MHQKYFRGYRVKIADKLPDCKSHFPTGIEAIIVGSYSDLYDDMPDTDEGEEHEYAVLLLKEVPDHCAWYEESLLTLVSKDRILGEKLLQLNKEN